MNAFVTAGAGFLLAVLWFDLMFDVQALRSRRRGPAGGEAGLDRGLLPAGHQRGAADEQARRRGDGGTITAIVVQIAKGDDPAWVGWVSLALVVSAVDDRGARTRSGAGARLGARRDPPEVQSAIARSILRDHLLCLPPIAAVLVIQLAFG